MKKQKVTKKDRKKVAKLRRLITGIDVPPANTPSEVDPWDYSWAEKSSDPDGRQGSTKKGGKTKYPDVRKLR